MAISTPETAKGSNVVFTSNNIETGTDVVGLNDQAALHVEGSRNLPRPYRVLGLKLLAYSHPRVQVAMLGVVIFLTVGMYHVLTALGGAGQQTATLADEANIVLYAVFTVFCLISPACLNYFGLQASLCFGSIGYAAYASSLWCFNHTKNSGFVVFGGAWCGLSAAFLWTAERTGISVYASEDKKGFYVAIFWSIYQVGTMVGSAIPVAENWNAGTNNNSTVNDGTYIGLFVMMLIGGVVSCILYPLTKMVREDGTRVAIPSQLTWIQQLQASWEVLKANKWIMFMWPYAWSINYYGIYQNNNYNSPVFTVRGRALNTLMSGGGQVLAAWLMNILTDRLPMSRRHRAYFCLVFVWLLVNATWIGGYFAMVETVFNLPESERIDVYDSGYAAKAFLYIMYQFMDGCHNCYGLWFVGGLSNDVTELSVYFSMYTFWQSACDVAAYSLDFKHVSYRVLFGTSWGTQFHSFGPIMLIPIIMYWMKDTNIVKVIPIEGQTPDSESGVLAESNLENIEKKA